MTSTTAAALRWIEWHDGGAPPSTLALLDTALATELTSLLRCRRYHFGARSAHASEVAMAFLVHSVRAQRNVDQLAGRIVELGGWPAFAPEGLAERSLTAYAEPDTIEEMVRTAVSSERWAGACYDGYIALVRDADGKTSRLLHDMAASAAAFAEELGPPAADD